MGNTPHRHTAPAPTADLLSPRAAAAKVSLHKRTLSRWAAEGRLPVVKLGARTVRYPADALAALVTAATVTNLRRSTTHAVSASGGAL